MINFFILFYNRITISSCSKSSGGREDQKFSFTYKKDIHLGTDPGSKTCWDVQSGDGSPILTYACHGQGGNQLWKYNAVDSIAHFMNLYDRYCSNRSLVAS